MRDEAQGLHELRILAVDDEKSNLLLLRRVLERAGYTKLETTTEASAVLRRFVEVQPDLVLLDLHMPEIDGFDLMERLAPLTGGGTTVPFLVLTADATTETKRRALSMGARDFLTKPLDHVELLLRVRNLLQTKQLQDRLRAHNANLEAEVAERTRDIEQVGVEMLERLALAGEYRDDETQQHAWRIGRSCALLAIELGLPESEVDLIWRAASLHDIGKVGTPDGILLKPGTLSQDEFDQMRSHTAIGGKILSGSRSRLLRLAEEIALTHHERWAGGGYPHDLRGEQIPLAGRIVAVADVFDALTHERPYKTAWPVDRAVAEIVGQAGRQFDPGVVDAFLRLDHATLVSGAEGWKPSIERLAGRSQPAASAVA